jgi:hypothetical protein
MSLTILLEAFIVNINLLDVGVKIVGKRMNVESAAPVPDENLKALRAGPELEKDRFRDLFVPVGPQ